MRAGAHLVPILPLAAPWRTWVLILLLLSQSTGTLSLLEPVFTHIANQEFSLPSFSRTAPSPPGREQLAAPDSTEPGGVGPGGILLGTLGLTAAGTLISSVLLPAPVAEATTGGTMALYLQRSLPDVSGSTYNALTLSPPTPVNATNTATQTAFTAVAQPCENAAVGTTITGVVMGSDTMVSYGDTCLATFFSLPVGQALTINTADTNSLAMNIYATTTAATWATGVRPNIRVRLYKYDGSIYTLFGTMNSIGFVDGTYANALFTTSTGGTPSADVTFAATDRVVALLSWNQPDTEDSAGVDTTTISWGRPASPSKIMISYTALTPNKPSLTGTRDDDFTTAATGNCSAAGITYNTNWTCITPNGNAGDLNAATDSSQWLWLRNKSQTTPSNFGATPTNTYLYRALPVGDGTIRTVVNQTADLSGSNAGLLLWTSNTDRIAVEAMFDGAVRGVRLNNNGVFSNATALATNFNRVWLGWSKSGTSYQAQYSTDGTSWVNLGTAIDHAGAFTRTGLNAYSATTANDYAGAFEWFSTTLGTNFTLTPASNSGAITPGATACYTHTLTNTGVNSDSFNLTAGNNQTGFTTTFHTAASCGGGAVTSVGPVAAAGVVTVYIKVTAPAITAGAPAAGLVNTTTVTATGVTDTVATRQVTELSTTSQVATVTFTPNNAATQSATACYSHTLANTGNGSDTFNITSVNNQSGLGYTSAMFSVAGCTSAQTSWVVAANAQATIYVKVTIPGGRPSGEVNVTTVTATSSFNNTVSAAATDTTTTRLPSLSTTGRLMATAYGNSPRIVEASDGTLLALVTDNGGNYLLYESTDVGQTWSSTTVTTGASAAGGTALWANGWLYFAGVNASPSLAFAQYGGDMAFRTYNGVTLDQSQTAVTLSTASAAATSYTQTFKPTASSLSKIDLWLSSSLNNTTGTTLTLKLYPTGTDGRTANTANTLATKTIDSNTLTTTAGWASFTLNTAVVVDPRFTYALELTVSGVSPQITFYRSGVGATDYANGIYRLGGSIGGTKSAVAIINSQTIPGQMRPSIINDVNNRPMMTWIWNGSAVGFSTVRIARCKPTLGDCAVQGNWTNLAGSTSVNGTSGWDERNITGNTVNKFMHAATVRMPAMASGLNNDAVYTFLLDQQSGDLSWLRASVSGANYVNWTEFTKDATAGTNSIPTTASACATCDLSAVADFTNFGINVIYSSGASNVTVLFRKNNGTSGSPDADVNDTSLYAPGSTLGRNFALFNQAGNVYIAYSSASPGTMNVRDVTNSTTTTVDSAATNNAGALVAIGSGRAILYTQGSAAPTEIIFARLGTDTTSPTAAITAPTASSTVGGTLSFTGTASDTNLDRYYLEYGSGGTPSTWTEFGASRTGVTTSTLGSFNTALLANGLYTFRLTVYDKFSNSATATVTVTIYNINGGVTISAGVSATYIDEHCYRHVLTNTWTATDTYTLTASATYTTTTFFSDAACTVSSSTVTIAAAGIAQRYAKIAISSPQGAGTSHAVIVTATSANDTLISATATDTAIEPPTIGATLYLHAAPDDVSGTYGSLSLAPQAFQSATTNSSGANPLMVTPCKKVNTTDAHTAIDGDTWWMGERCLQTFYSLPIGAATSITTSDTNKLLARVRVTTVGSGISAPFVYLRFYQYDGSTYTLFGTLTSAVIPGDQTDYWVSLNGTPSSNMTLAATDRIVAVLSSSAGAATGNPTLTVSFGTVAQLSRVQLGYAFSTPNRPSLVGAADDDFTTAANASCTSGGTTYNTKWTCVTPNGNAGALRAGTQPTGDSTQWLWLSGYAQTTPSNFGTTPTNTYVYQTMPAGDGSVRTVVNSPLNRAPTGEYGAAGVVFWTSNTDYLIVEAMYNGTTRGVQVNNSGVVTNVTAISAYSRIWLGLTKAGTNYQPQYSTDGTTWTNLGTAIAHSTAFTRMGLNAYSKSSTQRHTAAFEWFDSTITTAAVTISTGTSVTYPYLEAHCFRHVLTNTGTASDTFTLTASAGLQTVAFYSDAACTVSSSTATIAAAGTAQRYAKITLSTANGNGYANSVTITATSGNEATITAAATDTATEAGTRETTLYLHAAPDDVSGSYGTLSLAPQAFVTATTNASGSNPAVTAPCKKVNTTDAHTAVAGDTSVTAEGCIQTFYSPPVGRSISVTTSDTQSLLARIRVTTVGSGTSDPTVKLRFYQYNGSTYTLFGTLTSAVIPGDQTGYWLTLIGTPSANVTLATTDRIVVLLSSVVQTTGSGNPTLTASFGTTDQPSWVQLGYGYSFSTPNRPSLVGAEDDDFTTAASSSCTAGGATYNTKWTCITPNGNAGALRAGSRPTGDSVSWLWLSGYEQTTSSNFGTTPTNTYVYQTMPAGDGSVRTVVSSPLNLAPTNGELGAAGVVLWTSNTDYLSVEAMYNGTTRGVQVNNSGTPANVTAVSAYSRIWLGITKTSTNYQPQYSTDGTTWINLGTAIAHSTAFTRMGLNAYSKSSTQRHTAAFEWFDSTLAAVTYSALVSGPGALAAGFQHTCALLNTGNVRCWGVSTFGQLGLGNTTTIGDNENPTTDVNLGGTLVTQLAAGTQHTCALLSTGNVRCWGYNNYGQLGLGNTTTIGDDENPTTDVNLGGAPVTQIVVGDSHTCALLSTGNVRCWGFNFYGQLGLGNTTDIGDNENPTTDVNLGGTLATQLAVGQSHTCALLTTGNVRCWGYNGYGQLGLGNTTDIGDNENPTTDVNLGGTLATQITTGIYHTCALLTTGNVRCWGFGGYGALGLGNTATIGDNENPTTDVNLGGTTVTQVIVGGHHTCALLSTGNVRCWGRNNYGQLGLGNTTQIGDNENPTTDVNLSSVFVTQLAAAAEHTCALLATGDVRCWGRNSGQLGLGNTTTIGDDENPTTNVNLGAVTVVANAKIWALAGANACYPIFLANTGSSTDTVGLVLSGNSWTSTLQVGSDANCGGAAWSATSLAAGAITKLYLKVVVAAGATSGVTDTVTLTSRVNVASPVDSGTTARTTVSRGSATAAVTLTPARTGSGDPVSTVCYTHTLTNTGAASDTMTLTFANSLGGAWAATSYSVAGCGSGAQTAWTLAAAAATSVYVKVTIPSGALGGAVNVTTTTATSGTDNTVSAAATATTTVNNTAGVTLVATSSGNADPGGTVCYPHTLTNTGNISDTITMSHSNTQGSGFTVTFWTAAGCTGTNTTSFTLGAGVAGSVYLRVAVAAAMPPGTVNVTTATATSGNDNSKTAALTDRTVSNQPIPELTCTITNTPAAPGITFLVDPPAVTNDTGTSASITIASNAVRGYKITVLVQQVPMHTGYGATTLPDTWGGTTLVASAFGAGNAGFGYSLDGGSTYYAFDTVTARTIGTGSGAANATVSLQYKVAGREGIEPGGIYSTRVNYVCTPIF